ncbi:Hypothetical protein NTJ_05216 [Nesidiocoris tenuis]|uniref:Uncharacterized protein n=1 Tax=Nesidiocoris tenuis TaxID=355587 RepID=A0ABN7APS9_9HEMI|nr:Hypothetical protein NTJ_05216 [Nesidiocoris tenuis]
MRTGRFSIARWELPKGVSHNAMQADPRWPNSNQGRAHAFLPRARRIPDPSVRSARTGGVKARIIEPIVADAGGLGKESEQGRQSGRPDYDRR